MIDALAQVGGSEVLSHLTYRPDPVIHDIVSGWPSHFESARATRLVLVEAKYFPPWLNGSRSLDNPTGVLEFQTWGTRVQCGWITTAQQDHATESPTRFMEEL